MGRNLNRSKASYKKRCFWYKNKLDLGKVVQDDILQGVFYAKIKSVNKNTYLDGATRRILKTVMIETPDSTDVMVDNFILLDGELYRVISVDDIPLPYGRFDHVITMQRSA